MSSQLKASIEQDLKAALLGGDKARVEVLRGLKSAILYEEVAQKVRDTGLDDKAVLAVIAREAKKRTESADLYEKTGAQDRAETERAEKAILETYLPAQLSDEELAAIVGEVVAVSGEAPQLGQVIGAVKQKADGRADGGRIAAMVKSRLQK